MKENWRREENAWRIVVEELVRWRPTTSRLRQELISEKEKSSRFFKHQKEVRVWKYEFWTSRKVFFFFSFYFTLRNSIHTPRSSLYTPLNLTIDENTNLPLKLLYTPHLRLSVLMSGHVRCASSFLSSSFLSSAHPIFVPQARMAFKNSDNGAEISFETVEKEEDEVQV